jgi:hypothetical protein
MWMDAERDGEESDGDRDASDEGALDLSDHGAYWRRRFLFLCAGVVALGVCAWLLPGARQAPGTSAAARESMAAAATRQSLPPAAYGAAWSSPTPSPSPSLSPSLADSAKLAEKAKKLQKTSSLTTSTADGKAAAACAPAGIVLSLFASQASYDQKARPRFNVYAVSTAAADCTLTYGPDAVQVIVTNHGHVVWNSAACGPPATHPVRFTLGVPQLLTMTWNRKAARPAGCAGSLPAGFTGTLRAVAMSHGQSSPVRSFKITG